MSCHDNNHPFIPVQEVQRFRLENQGIGVPSLHVLLLRPIIAAIAYLHLQGMRESMQLDVPLT